MEGRGAKAQEGRRRCGWSAIVSKLLVGGILI
jgi:hypothetical protein